MVDFLPPFALLVRRTQLENRCCSPSARGAGPVEGKRIRLVQPVLGLDRERRGRGSLVELAHRHDLDGVPHQRRFHAGIGRHPNLVTWRGIYLNSDNTNGAPNTTDWVIRYQADSGGA